jgi:hypothetical protein
MNLHCFLVDRYFFYAKHVVVTLLTFYVYTTVLIRPDFVWATGRTGRAKGADDDINDLFCLSGKWDTRQLSRNR